MRIYIQEHGCCGANRTESEKPPKIVEDSEDIDDLDDLVASYKKQKSENKSEN